MFEKKNCKDIQIGDVFSYWTVLEKIVPNTNSAKVIWRCKCKCGTIRDLQAYRFISGHSKSCGCFHKEQVSNSSFVDITGQKFGRLTALKFVGYDKFGFRLWKCRCDCENQTEIIVTYSSLVSGHTNSCGCYGKEMRLKANTKHGLYTSRPYGILKDIKSRCYNHNSPEYYLYGGRGITVCDEWMTPENGFINFYNWALANKYRDDLTIDRIDVNGPYAPWNCRWITNQEQQWNKRDTIKTIDGYPIAKFSYNYGIPWKQIRDQNPDIESITVQELYERYFWPNDEPIVW